MKHQIFFMLMSLLSVSFIQDDTLKNQKIINELIAAGEHSKAGMSIGRYIYNHGVDKGITDIQLKWYKLLKVKLLGKQSSTFKFVKLPSEKNCFEGELDSSMYLDFENQLNFTRAVAGVQFVNGLDEVSNKQCQKAAWCLRVNNTITHQIPLKFKCYSKDAASAAAHANLTYGYSYGKAIFGMMRDEGSENYAVGHRRWLLHPPLTFPGFGLTDLVAVVQVFGDKTSFRTKYADLEEYKKRPIVWPVAGVHPEFLNTNRFSFSLNEASFSSAVIKVLKNGKAITVKKLKIETGYGYNTMVFDVGETPKIGEEYIISITNVKLSDGKLKNFKYTTKMVGL